MAMLSVVSLSFAYAPGGLVPAPFASQRAVAAAPQLLSTVIGSRSAISRVQCQADAAAAEIAPPKLESAVGFDFVPLLTALQAGEYREADFITRAALIKIAGDAAVARDFVYWTEASKLPMEDMVTMERLWRTYSDGKFGFAVQHKCFESKKISRDFEKFFDRIGWKNKEGSLLRWLPEEKGDEFIYDLEKAPKGHLPLTSALRGTRLLEGLLDHPAWETEEFAEITF